MPKVPNARVPLCVFPSQETTNLRTLFCFPALNFCIGLPGGDLLTLLMSDVPLGWKFRINIARGAASALVSVPAAGLIVYLRSDKV